MREGRIRLLIYMKSLWKFSHYYESRAQLEQLSNINTSQNANKGQLNY